MSNSTRRNSRGTGFAQIKQVNNSKQYQEVLGRKSQNLIIDGESKLITGNLVSAQITERPQTTISKKKTYISENITVLKSTTASEEINALPSDHSLCNITILKLKDEIAILKKEKVNLENESKVVLAELSLVKEEKEILDNEILQLKKQYEILESSNSFLSEKCISLEKEMKINEENWQNEKEYLEKTINEIRKELEAKIIEIRSKHREEILELEEKNRLLKVHLADNLKMNSWERQQEIERISGDLEKSLENERNMRIQLNKLFSQKGDLQLCSNCQRQLKLDDGNLSKKQGKEKDLNSSKRTSFDFRDTTKGKVGGHKSADGKY